MVTITLCNGVEISKEEWTRLREMNPRMQPAQIKAAFERNLDDAVMNALDIHSQGVPRLDISRFSNPMIVGSGNAIAAAKIVFAGRKAVFADETNYQAVFAQHQPDGVIVVSASGTRQAADVVKEYSGEQGIDPLVITCNGSSPAVRNLAPAHQSNVIVTQKASNPSQVELFTYNTATYLGWVLSRTQEDPRRIKTFIEQEVAPSIPADMVEYNAFFFFLPDRFDALPEMLNNKFDELLRPMYACQAFTVKGETHSKTIINSSSRLYVAIGCDIPIDCTPAWHIPLPEGSGYGAVMAIAYTAIGHIQGSHPPQFKRNLPDFCFNRYQNRFGAPRNPLDP